MVPFVKALTVGRRSSILCHLFKSSRKFGNGNRRRGGSGVSSGNVALTALERTAEFGTSDAVFGNSAIHDLSDVRQDAAVVAEYEHRRRTTASPIVTMISMMSMSASGLISTSPPTVVNGNKAARTPAVCSLYNRMACATSVADAALPPCFPQQR